MPNALQLLTNILLDELVFIFLLYALTSSTFTIDSKGEWSTQPRSQLVNPERGPGPRAGQKWIGRRNENR